MKRRNFVKQSVAGAIVAATPLTLTGLVRADGGGGLSTTSTDTTDWWNTPTTQESWNESTTDWWNGTTELQTTIMYTELPWDPVPEFDPESNPPESPCNFVNWWTDVCPWPVPPPAAGSGLIANVPPPNGPAPAACCWREVEGCAQDDENIPTTNFIIVCPIPPQNGEALSKEQLSILNWCNTLQFKLLPPWCLV